MRLQPHPGTLAATLVLVLSGCGGGSSGASPAELGSLVVDINEETDWPSADAEPGVSLGSRYVFPARRDDVGLELFVTDGNQDQTFLLKDLLAGSQSSRPDDLTVVGDRAYFTAYTELGTELWVTDGTPTGTQLAADFAPGCADSDPRELLAFGDRLLLAAENDTDGRQLWIVGPGGATRLTDFGSDASDPEPLGVLGTVAVFSARTATTGRELYVTDGTPAGTRLLVDIAPGPRSGIRSGIATDQPLVKMGGALYFSADDDIAGRELWATDGTAAGTRLVADIGPGVVGSSPTGFTVAESKLFFRASGPAGSEPWVSDGTAAGTMQLGDLFPGGSSSPRSLTAFAGRVYFSARSPGEGTELWASDGTPGGTVLVKDTNPGPADGHPRYLTPVGRRLFFTVDSATHGNELWVTDGTSAGTTLYRDLLEGNSGSGGTPKSSRPYALCAHQGQLFFSASTSSGRPLHIIRGAQLETLTIGSPQTGTGATGTTLVLNGFGYFRGNDGAGRHGSELWRTDGTAAGTTMVADIQPGPGSSTPRSMFAYRDQILFVADDGTHGQELWRTDGTAAGTALVADLSAGLDASGNPNSSWPGNFVELDGRVYFTASTPTLGNELWVTNGTTAGTVLIADLRPGSDSSYPQGLVRLRDKLFFSAMSSASERELFVSDGSAAGTMLFFDFGGARSGQVRLLGGTSNFLVFRARGGDGVEPWATDGTPAGTIPLGDLAPGSQSSSPGFVGVLGDRVLFSARGAAGTRTLWITDGSSGGTTALGDFRDDIDGGTEISGRLYFPADTAATGMELWRTDGTPDGTELVADIAPGCRHADPGGLRTFDGLTGWFRASSPAHGSELYRLRADGTTELVRDLRPGPADSEPAQFVALNGGIWFLATDGLHGYEPWFIAESELR